MLLVRTLFSRDPWTENVYFNTKNTLVDVTIHLASAGFGDGQEIYVDSSASSCLAGENSVACARNLYDILVAYPTCIISRKKPSL